MAYKVFTNGSVLNASEVNENLMNQSVITFTSATARSSAITSPIEGMVTYLEDTNSYQTWNGSSWVGLVPQSPNAIINGAFEINQRGFTSITAQAYGFDRWLYNISGATGTFSSQSFTPGAAPVTGYEAANFARLGITTGNDFAGISQRIENVRSFANQTITVSFFAKGTNPTTENGLYVTMTQLFGSGGSPSVATSSEKFVLTSDWQRFSFTINIPSLTGKTIGADSSFVINIGQGASTSTDPWTLDLWGVQVEAGSVATPFRRNANSFQGELAACQRYYVRYQADSTDPIQSFAFGTGRATTFAFQTLSLPVQMRRSPTAIEFGSNLELWDGNTAATAVTSLALDAVSSKFVRFTANTASGLTQYRPYTLRAANSSTAFVGFTAEL